MRYLVVDVETTGLDLTTSNIIELGYALYERGNPTPLVMKSDLVKVEGVLDEEITKITGITDEMLAEFGREPVDVFAEFLDMVHQTRPEFFAGHNALEFDKPILANNLKRANLQLPNLCWLDTRIDLPLEYNPKSVSLIYMAADHNFLNPFPHRALFDVLTCGKLISHYPFEKLLAIINSPIVRIRAVVSYDNRGKASKRGFRWDADNRIWVKTIRSISLPKEQSQADFQIVIL